ncbi:MAG: phosphoglycerate kinase [Patescibacteria group bacterium]
MKTLKDLNLKNKRVLMRADFNVPLNDKGEIEDDNRIQAAMPTIKYILEQGGSIILMSHLGRPKPEALSDSERTLSSPKGVSKGKSKNRIEGPNSKFSLKPVAARLSELLGKPVELVTEYIDKEVPLEEGQVVLLENIRFHKEEKENDPEFSKKLAALGDVYVNDAFGTAHWAHASTEGVAHLLPHAAGLLLEKEITTLTDVVEKPEKPVVAIIGGAKISTKIQLIKTMLDNVDAVLLGGALANTVMLAQNHKLGKSMVEEELAPTVKDLLSNKLRVPVDVICAKEVKESTPTTTKAVGEIEDDDMVLDIGPDTVSLYADAISRAKTIIWNGPMGVFEIPDFAKGTHDVAKAVANSDAYSVIGGGETAQALKDMDMMDKVSFVSTGGGAMLEFLEGKELPAIKALQ